MSVFTRDKTLLLSVIAICETQPEYRKGFLFMTTLLLIRHGESEANRQGLFAGQVNPDLQEKGLIQAKATACFIADNFSVDKIYSSDLKRAFKTAQCLAELTQKEAIAEPRLREIDAGDWENMKFDDMSTYYPDEYNLWMNDIGNAYCVGGETVIGLGDRIMKILEEIAAQNDGKTVAVATHATPIRAVQSFIATGGFDGMKDIPWVSNASVTVLEYDGGWRIVEAGTDTHLAELKTVLPDNV